MLRWLSFLLLFVIIASLCTWLVKNDGSIVIEWFGYHLQTSTTFLVLSGSIFFAFIITIIQGLLWLIHTPKRYRLHHTAKKQARGLHAITQGFAAIAAGDSKQAKLQAHRAVSCLGTVPLTHILTAQTAQLSGDKKLAATHYQAMLENPETKIIALRGLLIQAMQEGDLEKALQFAENVRAVQPTAPWAITILLELYPKTRKWSQAISLIEQAGKQKLLSKSQVDRMLGIISLTKSQEYFQAEDTETALKLAQEAYKLLPNFAPALVNYSKILLRVHDKRKALKILEQGWKKDPHPDTIQTYLYAINDEANEARIEKIEHLVQMHPHVTSGHIAAAQTAINSGHYGKARDHLNEALTIHETPLICRLMADLERLKNANIDIINDWLNRAKTAQYHDPSWHCIHCHLTSHQWYSNCIRCHSFDSLVFDQDQIILPNLESKFIATPTDT